MRGLPCARSALRLSRERHDLSHHLFFIDPVRAPQLLELRLVLPRQLPVGTSRATGHGGHEMRSVGPELESAPQATQLLRALGPEAASSGLGLALGRVRVPPSLHRQRRRRLLLPPGRRRGVALPRVAVIAARASDAIQAADLNACEVCSVDAP